MKDCVTKNCEIAMLDSGTRIRFSLLCLPLILLAGCQTLPVDTATVSDYVYPRQGFTLQKNQSVVGKNAEVELKEDDSLPVIGRYFDLGFEEIVRANPHLDPWVPEPGDVAKLPMQFILPEGPRQGIVINLSAKRLYYFPKNSPQTVYSYPVGIGRRGWRTPLGNTQIIGKKSNPSWTPPASIRREHARNNNPLPPVIPAGPDNPLGKYAMRLGMSRYLIHGTNKPYGVGMSISHGCVRLYPEDISELFQDTPVGTLVRLIDQPYLAAWDEGRLFLQAYPLIRNNKTQAKLLRNQIIRRLKGIEKDRRIALDWDKIEIVLEQKEGIPVPIYQTSVADSRSSRLPHPPFGYGDTTPPPLRDDVWRLRLEQTSDETQSKRLAAMLNHQGPPIPAHVKVINQTPTVIVGPFNNKDEADKAAGRIRQEFSIESVSLEPREEYAEKTASNNSSNWFERLANQFGID